MRKTLFLLLSLCVASVADAQMRINREGHVMVGDTTSSSAQLTATQSGRGEMVGVFGTAQASSGFAANAGGSAAPGVNYMIGIASGVRGEAGGGNTTYNYGVHGILTLNATGAGVFGTINKDLVANNSRLAGLFNGPVKITGSVSSNTFTTLSDNRSMQGVSNIEESATELLLNLHPVQYQWDATQYAKLVYGEDKEGMAEIVDKKLHYGFMAQELREICPNLVYGEEEDLLNINYTELIPILVQSIQELSAELRALRGDKTQKAAARLPFVEEEVEAVLYQNTPNPFSEQTSIKYALPENVKDAKMCIYNLSGDQLGEYTLSGRGESELIISASEYNAGMYLYTLIADGHVIDTKRMVLSK